LRGGPGKRRRPVHYFCQLLILTGCLQATDAQVVIIGAVLGHDGTPMPAAEVRLVNAARERIDNVNVGAAGAFELRAPHPGLFCLQFAGPLHDRKDVWILVDKQQTISLKARLSTADYAAEFKDLRLRTPNAKSHLNGRPLLRQPDGAFAADVETGDADILFAIDGLVKGGPPIGAPGSAEYRCVNLTCSTVVHPRNGKLRIVLDPSQLPRSSEAAAVRYADNESTVTRASMVVNQTAEFMESTRARRQEAARKER